MKKFLLIFVLVLNLTPALADEQSRVIQILSVSKEINATNEQVACAITDGCTPKEFIARVMGKIRLDAPDKAPTGSPIQISVEGLPETSTQLWRRHPIRPTDVWLELYDRSGKQVNIFWSSDAGPRTFELIVAENGPDVPTLDFATHFLQYGEGTPTVPSGPIPNTPSTELQRLVEPLATYAANTILDTGDLLNLTEFYFDFADVVRRDGANVISTTADFRAVYMNAGALMFQQTGMKGKYAGLSEIVDGVISNYVGLDVRGLNAVKTADVLNAVAWAFYQSLKGGE